MSRLLKLVYRRRFFARLLALATLPVVGKVATALAAEAPHALGGPETSGIDQAEALDRAREWAKGLGRVEPCAPIGNVYNHDPTEYFFFRLDRGRLYVGGDEIIAVRKTNGRVSYGGFVGE